MMTLGQSRALSMTAMMPKQMSSTWELEEEEEELGGEEGYTIRRRRRLCYSIASVLSPTDHPTSAASSSRSLTYPRCPSNPDLVDGIVHTVYEHT